VVIALVASLLQLVTGHSSAETVAETQPPKLAAMEGHFDAHAPAGLYLFGWVDEENRDVTGVSVPGLLSWLVHGHTDAPLTGLGAFPESDWPPVNVVFQSYHLMVAIGMMLILLSVFSTFGWWRGFLFEKRWLLWVLVFSVLLPQAANQLGWITAEVGRQPWIVYGLLRTEEALSTTVKLSDVWISLILFSLIYLLLLALFLYLLNEKIQHGPEDVETERGHLT